MTFTRNLLGLTGVLALGMGVGIGTLGCATSSRGSGDENVRVVRTEDRAPETGGIPPDKQAEIQLLLQQRNPSTLKCYNDVLAEKHDRSFKGHVAVMITLTPSGQASDVSIVSSNLNSKEVTDCLISKLKDFEYPTLDNGGTMQYVYHFEPAY